MKTNSVSRAVLNLLLLPAVLLAGGCADTIDAPDPEAGRLVVEGWIDSGGNPTVLLTRSLSPGNVTSTPMADLVVRWAEVTVSDGFTTDTLYGRIDRSITPPFLYTSNELTGVPGRRYTVSASYGGERVTAGCVMPVPRLIDRVEVLPVAGSDTLREVRVTFTPEPGGSYMLYVADKRISGRSLPCFMGTYRAPADSPGAVTLTACRPKVEVSAADESYSPYFAAGTLLKVSLMTLTPEVWDFWRRYDDITAFGGNIFLSTTLPLGGNVAGGYGVWSARGCDARIVSVE